SVYARSAANQAPRTPNRSSHGWAHPNPAASVPSLDNRPEPRPIRRARPTPLVHLPQRLSPQGRNRRTPRPHHLPPHHRHLRHPPYHRRRLRCLLPHHLQPPRHAPRPHLGHLRPLATGQHQHRPTHPQLRHQHHHPLPPQLPPLPHRAPLLRPPQRLERHRHPGPHRRRHRHRLRQAI